MSETFVIRHARPTDLPSLPDIEHRAAAGGLDPGRRVVMRRKIIGIPIAHDRDP